MEVARAGGFLRTVSLAVQGRGEGVDREVDPLGAARGFDTVVGPSSWTRGEKRESAEHDLRYCPRTSEPLPRTIPWSDAFRMLPASLGPRSTRESQTGVRNATGRDLASRCVPAVGTAPPPKGATASPRGDIPSPVRQPKPTPWIRVTAGRGSCRSRGKDPGSVLGKAGAGICGSGSGRSTSFETDGGCARARDHALLRAPDPAPPSSPSAAYTRCCFVQAWLSRHALQSLPIYAPPRLSMGKVS